MLPAQTSELCPASRRCLPTESQHLIILPAGPWGMNQDKLKCLMRGLRWERPCSYNMFETNRLNEMLIHILIFDSLESMVPCKLMTLELWMSGVTIGSFPRRLSLINWEKDEQAP